MSVSFASLGLSPPVCSAVAQLGYEAPTEVQIATIPVVLGRQDLWASAQTGSGKTAAFLLPLLDRLARQGAAHDQVLSLIVVPTRELALQIAEAVERYARDLPIALKCCVVVGGMSINTQILELRGGADIVVATPGRLLDLIDQDALELDGVQTLVLDEADRLFALGFADELGKLLALVPDDCQRLLFSATFPPKVQALAERHLRDPARINLHAGTMPAAEVIAQRVIEVDTDQRSRLLLALIKRDAWRQVLVFVASRQGADEVAAKLMRGGISAQPMHGDLSQAARVQALADFKEGQVDVLVATDLAARGLDIVQLPVVVNYDLPRSAADYVHRIGRTGRAGESGVAVSFVSVDTQGHFRLIERRHQLCLEREQIPGFEPRQLSPAPRDIHGGVKGKRKSKKDKLREAAARAQASPSDVKEPGSD